MKKLLTGIVAVATLTSFAMAASISSPGAKLIEKLSQDQLKPISTFAAPMDLQGFVVEAPNGQKKIFYTNKEGTYLLVGSIIKFGKDGKPMNLTANAFQKHISSKIAVSALDSISKTHQVVDSQNAKAPVMYVIWDPNCAYCHLLYKELRPMIDTGKVQVHWVPVAIRPHSKAKTAEILAAKTNKQAIALMEKDEAKFNMKKESGALKGIKKDSSKAAKEAYAQMEANTKFFISHNFIGTPVILYRNNQGDARMNQGYLPQKALNELLDSVAAPKS